MKDDLLEFFFTFLLKLILHPEVGDLVRELPTDQALEVLPVLADQVPVGALGEGAHAQTRDATLRAFEVEYLRLVSTRRPEGRSFILNKVAD